MTRITTRLGHRAGGVVLGLLLDELLGDPPSSVHPVAAFGLLMRQVERRCWADRFAPGLGYAVVGCAVGVAAGRSLRCVPLAVFVAVAGRSLRTAGAEVETRLGHGDLEGARLAVRSLVGRDASELDDSGLSAAVVESLAENTADAVVAPVFWAVVAGAPGVLGHRAVNTLDAMVGHRSPRYRRFGTASARLDDLANYIPARLYAGLVGLVHPSRIGAVARTVRRDAGRHPSPNAGVAEAAAAATLGRELGGPLRYGVRLEDRPRLGDGPRPTRADIPRARDLSARVELALGAALLLAALGARLPGHATGRDTEAR